MRLVAIPQITAAQLSEIEHLVAKCRELDGNELPIYPNLLIQHRSTACNVLCYVENKLVGFLSVFFFYEHACEIALMVLPKYRRQGIARKMLKEVLPILHAFQMEKILFSKPAGQDSEWLLAMGFKYQSSEYQMLRENAESLLIEDKSLEVRLATIEDVPLLCEFDSACFPTQTNHAADRFLRLVHDANYRLYIASLSGVPIGKAHLCWQKDGVRITDVAIMPHLQNQGFGRALLAYCINDALSKNKIAFRLDVETMNQRALHLYTGLGFKTINSYEYWATSITNDKLLKA